MIEVRKSSFGSMCLKVDFPEIKKFNMNLTKSGKDTPS